MVDVTGIEPVTPCLQIQEADLDTVKKNEKQVLSQLSYTPTVRLLF